MGYYDEQPPPHSHRAPSELGELQLPARLPPTPATRTAAALPATFQHLCTGEPFNLLLAIENDNNAFAAISVTKELTKRGAIPKVINVTRPPRPPLKSVAASSADAIFGESFHENRCRLLADLISNAAGDATHWPTESLIGDPAEKILEAAASENAELIVMGINNHGVFAQAMGQNTATRVMGKAPVPVLGVRPGMTKMPKVTMVATDFGESSRHAAQIAANFADPDGRLVLVHVTPSARVPDDLSEPGASAAAEEVADSLLRLTTDIREGRSIDVESLHRVGDPVDELLAAAQLIGPGLIAIGSERRDGVTRLPLESFTRALVREGRWSMLVTPPVPSENSRY
jgi:nucleotide-binding universal stress UspA family protein